MDSFAIAVLAGYGLILLVIGALLLLDNRDNRNRSQQGAVSAAGKK